MRRFAIALIAVAACYGQQAFDVASVRVNRSAGGVMHYEPARGGRFTATNCSLSLLLQYAFQVMRFQISGAADWARSDRYDIAAKAPGDPQIAEMPGMLRHLLEDRFQLKYHWDTREAPAYNLVVSKAGKLRNAAERDCRDAGAPCGSLMNSPGHTRGYSLTANELAGSLQFFTQMRVIDKTGLTGKYDVELQWAPDPTDTSLPSIFTALQEQLGLRLESARGPVQFLVIDHIERPSENR